MILHIYNGLPVNGTFKVKLPPGKYSDCRLILFNSPDNKSIDFGNVLFDTARVTAPNGPINLNLAVTSINSRVVKPTLSMGVPQIVSQGGDKYDLTVPAVVKVPGDYAGKGGFWAMLKGPAGFSQVWAPLNAVQPGTDPKDPYRVIPISFHIAGVAAGAGILDSGLFNENWGDPIEWNWHGLQFEAGGGSWVHQAPPGAIPPRLRVAHGRFVTTSGTPHRFYADAAATGAAGFVRGGDYGNAICWDTFPELDTPGYFVLLRDMGCRFIRFNFNPDRFLSEPLYQHAVDQVVQNILAAGLYPIVAPQDLPAGDTLSLRIAGGLALMQAIAGKYAGQSVWIEICNEPHEFSSWQAFKPVAEQYVRKIRSIDPGAFVIVPFEGYSKDGRGAALDPITSTPVDLYDGHAYLDPAAIKGAFGPAIDAGLPVLIGEYGGNTSEYLHSVDRSLEGLHGLMAAAPWAFTIPGQDSIPLIQDGSSAVLAYTPAGKAIADDYASWDAGKSLQ